MTEERKNEIWSQLPYDFKELVTKMYKAGVPYDAFKYDRRAPEYRLQAEGGLYMLEFLFGTHNLTAQLDETPPKSPSGQNRSLSQDVADCDIETEDEEALPRMEYIAMMEEKKVELEKLRKQMNDRYSQYRLDLAKEIAVAMITSRNEPVLRSIAEVAVDTTNEIVKRLKETEE